MLFYILFIILLKNCLQLYYFYGFFSSHPGFLDNDIILILRIYILYNLYVIVCTLS